MRINYQNINKAILLSLVGFCFIGMAAAILITRFGRPIGDDYGAITTYHSKDLFHQAYISVTTTGRYSQSLASSFFYGILGEKITRILPLLAVIWLNLTSYLYIKVFLKKLNYNNSNIRPLSAGLSVLLSFLILFVNNTPNTTDLPSWSSYQLFFWSSGIITYSLPLLLLLGGYYYLFLSRFALIFRSRSKYVFLAVLVLITGMFNETQPAILLAFCTLLYSFSYLRYFKGLVTHKRALLLSATISLIALAALYFSPGRSQRSSTLSSDTPMASGTVFGTVIRNLHTIVSDLYFRPTEIVLLILVGLILFWLAVHVSKDSSKLKLRLKHFIPYLMTLPLLCIISTVISTVLVAIGYGLSAGVYSRTLLISQVTYVLALIAVTFSVASVVYVLLSKARAILIIRSVTLLFALGFVLSVPRHFDKIMMQINSSVTYYNLWNIQDSNLTMAARNNKPETVYLKNPATGIGDGFSLTCEGQYAKTTMWLNVQITQYYGGNDRVCSVPVRPAAQDSNVVIVPWNRQ